MSDTPPPPPPGADKFKKNVQYDEEVQYNLSPHNTGLTLQVVPDGASRRPGNPNESFVRLCYDDETNVRLDRDETLRLIAALQRAIELFGPEGDEE